MGFEAPEEDETSQGQGHVVRKVKEFYLEPLTMQPAVGEEEYLSVDDEQFEVMPMHVALMKRRITCFSPQWKVLLIFEPVGLEALVVLETLLLFYYVI